MRIDLGGGLKPAPGYVNLDPTHGEGEWRRYAQETPWPAKDGEVSRIRASHVIEHIPAGADRIVVLNECWRVLKPGGLLEITVPLFPSWQAVADPTHVSYWCEQSFWYLDGRWHYDADYGLKPWEFVAWMEQEGWQGTWMGRKPQ